MRAALYSPYLDTFGGGERYMMTIAEFLSSKGFEVDVALDPHLENIGSEFLKKNLSGRFNLNLSKVKFIKGPFGKNSNSLNRIFFLRKYNFFFYLTDGSIFLPSAKKNFLHIQSPLVGQPTISSWGKTKLKKWNLIIYNSEFTKKYSEKNWPIKSKVIYPPVDISNIKPLKKKNYILSVGRFFGYLKDKKHEILIKTFIDLCDENKIKGWSLHLVGSASEGDQVYLDQLKQLAKNYPVEFYPNLGYEKLVKLYGESSIYWHASGFGEDDPTKMEHFGISTVEAMAGGCVPIVIAKGGQLEIVENNISGFLWQDLEQFKALTIKIMDNGNLRKKVMEKAIDASRIFSKEEFQKKIEEIIR